MEVAPPRRRTLPAVGMVAGGFLCFSPVFGLIGTVIGLMHAFDATATGDPSEKSVVLAHGISVAMRSTAVGLAILPVGAAVFLVSLWRFLRRPDP